MDWALAAAVIIILMGALIQGMAGFGFSQFVLPLLVLILASRELIPVMVVLSLFLNILLISGLRRHVRLRRIWPMMAGGALGIPIGTYILLIADADLLKIMIGILILVFGTAQLFNARRKLKNEKPAMGPLGFAGGILNGSVSMSGPPLILFFSNQGYPKKKFKANLIAFFLFINIATLPFFLYAGLLTRTVVETSGLLLPGMLIGAFAGSRLSRGITESKFRKGVLVLVMAFGCMAMASGLGIF
jgi:uncharacterized membrane protein YfcA